MRRAAGPSAARTPARRRRTCTGPSASAASGGRNRITVPARPQSTAPPPVKPAGGVIRQVGLASSTCDTEGAQTVAHQPGVPGVQAVGDGGRARGESGQHQGPVGLRLRARDAVPWRGSAREPSARASGHQVRSRLSSAGSGVVDTAGESTRGRPHPAAASVLAELDVLGGVWRRPSSRPRSACRPPSWQRPAACRRPCSPSWRTSALRGLPRPAWPPPLARGRRLGRLQLLVACLRAFRLVPTTAPTSSAPSARAASVSCLVSLATLRWPSCRGRRCVLDQRLTALLRPVAEAGPALGVARGDQHPAEQADVLQEVVTVGRPLGGIGALPERVLADRGRHQRQGQQAGAQPTPLAGGQRDAADQLEHPVDPHPGLGVGRDVALTCSGANCCTCGTTPSTSGSAAGTSGLGIADGLQPADDEVGGQHGAGGGAQQRHGPFLPCRQSPDPTAESERRAASDAPATVGGRPVVSGTMCGRYASTSRPDTLVQEFDIDEILGDLPGPDYNVAPTVAVPAVLERRSQEHRRSRAPPQSAGLGPGAVLGQGRQVRRPDDQRAGRDGGREAGLPPRLRRPPLPAARRRLLRVVQPGGVRAGPVGRSPVGRRGRSSRSSSTGPTAACW